MVSLVHTSWCHLSIRHGGTCPYDMVSLVHTSWCHWSIRHYLQAAVLSCRLNKAVQQNLILVEYGSGLHYEVSFIWNITNWYFYNIVYLQCLHFSCEFIPCKIHCHNSLRPQSVPCNAGICRIYHFWTTIKLKHQDLLANRKQTLLCTWYTYINRKLHSISWCHKRKTLILSTNIYYLNHIHMKWQMNILFAPLGIKFTFRQQDPSGNDYIYILMDSKKGTYWESFDLNSYICWWWL